MSRPHAAASKLYHVCIMKREFSECCYVFLLSTPLFPIHVCYICRLNLPFLVCYICPYFPSFYSASTHCCGSACRNPGKGVRPPHIEQVCRCCYYQLKQLRVIARSLTFNAAVSLVH